MSEIKQRHEIIFLYDVKDANPNGDPDDGNRPRMDHLGYNIVTDVRLKRTIRDYWNDHYHGENGKKVLVKRVENLKDGSVKSMAQLITDALGISDKVTKEEAGEIIKTIRNKIPETYIDVRFFGGAFTLTNANVSLTGPLQFGIGRSLNRPRVDTHTITTTFSSGEGKTAGTFGATHVVDYSLLCFGGILSETTAKETGLSESDLKYLWEGIWKGTKNLNTRSKFNHNPRLLLSIVSNEGEFQIGGMYRRLKLKVDNEELRINSEEDVIIDISKFIKRLSKYKTQIDRIQIIEDDMIKFYYDGQDISSLGLFLEEQGYQVEKLEL